MFRYSGIKEVIVGLVADDRINITKLCYDDVRNFSYSAVFFTIIKYYTRKIAKNGL
jgi:hypothetical protein